MNAFDSTLIYVVYSTPVTYAQIYFLKVAQTHQIQVQFFNRTYYKYFVYNGPGFKSKLLKSFANIVVTSSFQCIVEIYGAIKNFTTNAWYTYFPLPIKKYQILKLLHNENLLVNFPRKDNNWDIMHFIAPISIR